MSIRRLALTVAAMTGAALGLLLLTPDVTAALRDVAGPQHTVDTRGAEALLVSATGLLAWGVWAWGALGLVLTAGTAVPGVLGASFRVLAGLLLPSTARQAAAVALGLGLAAPVLLGGSPVSPAPGHDRPVLAAARTALDVPDWPLDDAGRVPDWPSGAAHLVVSGDCLWDIAEDRLTTAGGPPGDAEVATAVQGWWSANRAVIGPDPDLIRPGQVLRPPQP
jgi:hypothetical protein